MNKSHFTPREKGQGAGLEVITTHINADFDALASMIAAKRLYPQAIQVFSGAQESGLRNFFLHSASYVFDFAKIKQINLERIKRLIIVDTRQKSRIGKFARVAERPDVEVHIYDHHPPSDDDIEGQLEVVRPTGSTTAILAKILREKGIQLTPDEATIMVLGIHEDTGSFTFSSTTPEDYEAAAWLATQGANHNVVSDMLTRELTAEQLWVLNDLTRSAITKNINGVELVVTKVVRDEYIGDFAVLVHKFMEMENLNVVFALAQMEDRVHLVARSRVPEVDVGKIAVSMGGGGHPQAASATIRGKTLAQVERSLNAILRGRIRPMIKAKEMMSSPVISLPPEATIKRAANLMTKFNINVLLVIEEEGEQKGKLLGFVTRQVVEKAMFFNLDQVKVSEYMNIEFYTVSPDASLQEVQELIIKTKLRVLPVLDGDRVVGVITRTDLLNILVGEPVVPEPLYLPSSGTTGAKRKNLAGLLKEQVPRKIIERLKQMGQVADIIGYNIYLVGGFVRDILLKRGNFAVPRGEAGIGDVDVVIEGDGIEFAHEFSRHFEVRVKSHKKYGTAVLIFPDGFKVDVATARMEYYEAPGASPIVRSSSLKMDLYRRDFTINTLAVKLNKRDYGLLVDYFGAQRDIKEKVIRVLHNLSFVEDPTRVFRAIRFEQRFGFKIGKLTLALIRNAVKINCFKDVAGHRLFLELKLILQENDPIRAIERMEELDLLQFISPKLKLDPQLHATLAEIKNVVSWFQLLFLEEPFESWWVYWHGLTSRLDPKDLYDMAHRLGMQDARSQRMLAQRQGLMGLVRELYKFKGTNYELYTLLSPYDTEILLYVMARSAPTGRPEGDKVKRLISFYFTRLKGTRVELKGKDLISLGLKPGPKFRLIFEELLKARLNQEINSREEEIRFVMDNYLEGGMFSNHEKKTNC